MTYRIELGTAQDGTLLELDGADISRPRFNISHSQLADWSFQTHYDPDLTQYADVFAPIRVYWEDTVLFRGEVVRHKYTNDGPGGKSVSTLEGHDRAFTRLKRSAPLEIVEYEGVSARDAIEDYWALRTPYEADVADQPLDDLPPIDHVELTDNHLSNLQKLHDRANFVFSMDHASGALEVTSMARGQRTRDAAWELGGRSESEALSVGHDDDRREYANIVVALGAHDEAEGGRLRYDAVNPNEIARLRGLGCPPDKSCAIAMVSDPDAETPGEVRTMAETELARRVEQRKTKGEIDVLPTWVQPGFAYDVDALDEDGLVLEDVTLNVGIGETATLTFIDHFGYAKDVATLRGQVQNIVSTL